MIWKLITQYYKSRPWGGFCSQGDKVKMRLDKYLKISRLIKRRTVANQACDAGKVMVNGKTARASCEVKIGDTIEIAMGTRRVYVEVLSVQEYANKVDALQLYRILP